MDETLVPIIGCLTVFGSIAAMVIVPFWLKERTKQSAHRVISEAIARGQPLDPAVMDQLTQSVGARQQQSSPRRTLGNGLVLLALGVAFGVADWFKNGGFTGYLEWPAMILGALGLAFTILAIVDYMTQKKTDK